MKAKTTLPLPTKEKRRLIQAEINTELAEAVSEEARKHKTKFRQLIEWSLSNYLLETNPRKAKELGIRVE